MAMQKQDVERILNQVRTLAPGSSDSGIKAKLYEVLKQFFEDGLTWREDIVFQAQANVQNYPLVPQRGGQVFSIFGVWDGNRLPVASFLSEDFDQLGVVYPITSTPPTTWTARVFKTVMLPTDRNDIPDAPRWVAAIAAPVIIDGLVGNLCLEQGKTYTNAKLADYHLKRFRTGIVNTRVSMDHAHIRGAQSWSFPRNFRTNSQQGGLVTAWPGIGYGE